MNLEEAREQLLSQIELELCRIHVGNFDAPKKLQEFYDYVSSLHEDHFLFDWYITNKGNIDIDVTDGEVRVIKTDDQGTEQHHDEIIIPNIHDDLIRRVFDNQN